MSPDKIMEIADDFKERFYAGDIQIVAPTDEKVGKSTDHVDAVAQHQAQLLIRGKLNETLFKYLKRRSQYTAQRLVDAITTARSQGMIIESESKKSKIERFEQENTQLKKENVDLQKEVAKLKALTDALHKTIANLTPKKDDSDFHAGF